MRRLCCPAKASSSTGKQPQLRLGALGFKWEGHLLQHSRRLKSSAFSHHITTMPPAPSPDTDLACSHCTPTCRLKSHVFSHYVDGQLYREPRLHLRTLRRLTPKLAAMKKPGGKVSWAILNQGKQPSRGGRGVGKQPGGLASFRGASRKG